MSALHASWMRSVQHLSNPTLQRARDLFKIYFRVDVLTGLVHVVDEDHQCIADPLRTEGVPCVVLCFTTLPVLNEFVEHQLAPLVQVGMRKKHAHVCSRYATLILTRYTITYMHVYTSTATRLLRSTSMMAPGTL